MSDEVTQLIEDLFARVTRSFPVSESPYCDLAEAAAAEGVSTTSHD